jgi:CubicO group peptidase (beta-lactamase class C family)
MKKLLSFILMSKCLLLTLSGFGQDYGKLDAYLGAMAEQKKFIGSILVAQGDSVVYQNGFGPASANGDEKNSAESQYLIGSITKTFTAIAVLQLFEKGKLALSDPLSKYVSLFPNSEKITIRHLLSHRSGIKNYTDLPDIESWLGDEISSLLIVEKVMDYPLAFEPGSMYSYSNTNYILLGIIIEQVSGSDYEKYLNENVLKPMGLKNTGMNYKKAKELSVGLVPTAEGWTAARKVNKSVPFSAGALYSCTEDMYTFSKAFFNAEFFESETTYEMMINFDEGSYAFGVFADQIDEDIFIGHNGGIDGYAANWAYFQDLDLHAVVLSNYAGSDNTAVLDAILHIQSGKEVSIPEERKAINMSREKLEKTVGLYEIQKGFNLNVFLENEKLMAQASGQGALELFAQNDSTFFATVADIEIVFHMSGNNPATALTLYQSGGQTKAPRIESNKKVMEIDVADLKVLEGTYTLQEGFELRIFTEGDKLMGQATGQESFELFAESRKDFFNQEFGLEISFSFNENGETKGLTLYQSGAKFEAEKKQL